MFGKDRTCVSDWLGKGAQDDTTSLEERYNIYKSLLAQTGFLVLASIFQMDDLMAHVLLEILPYVQIGAHDVYILNIRAFPSLIV